MDDLEELVETIDLGGTQGRPRRGQVSVEIVRELTEADIPLLLAPALRGAGPGAVGALRHSHHQLAQLLARGVEVVEASLITGYTTARIWQLKRDASFEELLGHYASEREACFVDVIERMRSLGLATLEELQQRLDEEPGEWSRRELMEMAELMLIKPQVAARGGAGSGGPAPAVNVQLNFVKAEQPAPRRDATPAEAIDLEWKDSV